MFFHRTIFIVLLFSPITVSADEWTKTDTGLQLAVTGLLWVDRGQTLRIAEASRNMDVIYRPDGDYLHAEENGILGRAPSKGKVNRYFAGTLIGHYLVARWLNKPWRNIWQSFWIGTEYNVITHNKRNGFKISFSF